MDMYHKVNRMSRVYMEVRTQRLLDPNPKDRTLNDEGMRHPKRTCRIKHVPPAHIHTLRVRALYD
jgi:hypothetical protein